MSEQKSLSQAQRDDLRTIAAMIIPPSDEYNVPGADDAAVQADLVIAGRRRLVGVREGAGVDRVGGVGAR